MKKAVQEYIAANKEGSDKLMHLTHYANKYFVHKAGYKKTCKNHFRVSNNRNIILRTSKQIKRKESLSVVLEEQSKENESNTMIKEAVDLKKENPLQNEDNNCENLIRSDSIKLDAIETDSKIKSDKEIENQNVNFEDEHKIISLDSKIEVDSFTKFKNIDFHGGSYHKKHYRSCRFCLNLKVYKFYFITNNYILNILINFF